MRPTRATRKPDRYSPPPFPVRSYRPLVKRPRLTLSRAAQLGKKTTAQKILGKNQKENPQSNIIGNTRVWY